jgi:hypothetical protein
MPVNPYSSNPFTTVAPYATAGLTSSPSTGNTSYNPSTVSTARAQPWTITSFPAVFLVSSEAATSTATGLIFVPTAGTLTIAAAGATFSVTAATTILSPSVTAGVLTMTTGATYAGGAYSVTRLV